MNTITLVYLMVSASAVILTIKCVTMRSKNRASTSSPARISTRRKNKFVTKFANYRKNHPDKQEGKSDSKFNTELTPKTWAQRPDGIHLGHRRTSELVEESVPGVVTQKDPLKIKHVKEWDEDEEVIVAEWLFDIPDEINQSITRENEAADNIYDKELHHVMQAWQQDETGTWHNSVLKISCPDASIELRHASQRYAAQKGIEYKEQQRSQKS